MNKTDDVKEQVLNEYNNGAKATDLAKKYGISRGTIYLWIDNKRKGTLSFNQNKKDEILRLFKEEHKPVDELAKQFDTPKATIYQWIARENLELTPEQTDDMNITLRANFLETKRNAGIVQEKDAKIKELEQTIKVLTDSLSHLNDYLSLLKEKYEK